MYVGSIEIQIATMSKAERHKTAEVYVCGFIPSYQLPNKTPCSLDPFLSPLISEIEDAFIEGMCMHIKLYKRMYISHIYIIYIYIRTYVYTVHADI